MPQDWPANRPPPEVLRTDIDRVHSRLDQMAEGQMAHAVLLARIEERIAQIKPVALPPRPCPFFDKHMEAHAQLEKENRATWRDVLIKIATPALSAAGGAIAVVMGTGKT